MHMLKSDGEPKQNSNTRHEPAGTRKLYIHGNADVAAPPFGRMTDAMDEVTSTICIEGIRSQRRFSTSTLRLLSPVDRIYDSNETQPVMMYPFPSNSHGDTFSATKFTKDCGRGHFFQNLLGVKSHDVCGRRLPKRTNTPCFYSAYLKSVDDMGPIDQALLPENGLILRTCVNAVEWINEAVGSLESFSSRRSERLIKTCSTVTKRTKKMSLSNLLRSWILKVTIASIALVVVPLWFYASIPAWAPNTLLKYFVIGWNSLLHTSIWPIVWITSSFTLLMTWSSNYGHRGCFLCRKRWNRSGFSRHTQTCGTSWKCSRKTAWMGIRLVLLFSVSTTLTSQLQIVGPSWIWNPFLWFTYKVYHPYDIPQALHGLCVDNNVRGCGRHPLCLSNSSWKTLSSGMLSSRDADDVKSVERGVKFARDVSGGLIISVMSRDTIDAIQPLRFNVEGLLPFFVNLAVVVFENDSKDGSRKAFKQWAADARGYNVDLIECEEALDCKFGAIHRYDAADEGSYFTSSSIGRMAEFRQRMVDYIMTKPLYTQYSHMLILDLDLSVSLSPFGVLHTLGKLPHEAVASAGRQVWPGSFGTLVPPYDFSAFRAIQTQSNRKLLQLHRRFCELMPAGDRWRNQCDAVSPMHLMLVLFHDWSGHEPYNVASAFNGAALYPLQLIRESDAKYDVGDDGQRCEHIGFNFSLRKPMYVNPKWTMHINPVKPGGPTGTRALKNIARIVFTPRLSVMIFFQNIGCMLVFVYSIMVLTIYVSNPLILKMTRFVRTKIKRAPLTELHWRSSNCDLRVSMQSGQERRNYNFEAVKYI